MTTIAYRDGVMAGDTQVNAGNLKHGRMIKVRKIGDYVVGASGSFDAMELFFQWARDAFVGEKRPNLRALADSAFGGIVVDTNTGIVYEYEADLVAQEFFSDYRAIGSGWQFAYGAMAMGADAETAIQIASKHDRSTGGEITVVRCTDDPN